MEETLHHDNPNPMLTDNCFSRALYCWLNPLLAKGYANSLEETDMYNVCPADASSDLGQQLQLEWDKELERKVQGKKPSLGKALLRTFGLKYMLVGFFGFVEEGIKVLQPVLIAQLLGYFTPDSTTTREEAWMYASGVAICAMVLVFMHQPYFFGTARTGMQMRISCCSLMFRKCLRLSNKSLNQSSVGQIVNLMSNDVSRFDRGMIYLHFLWLAPLQATAALIILWYEIGPSVFAGLAFLLLLMPAQVLMAKVFTKLRRKTAIHTDKRVKVMNEIISGMRIIKMYCWEKPFRHLVEKLRSEEIRHLRRTRHIQACIFAPFFPSAQVSIFLLFLTFTVTGKAEEMRSSTVFLTMGLLQAIRLCCALMVPLASQNLAEVLVVIKRIQNFLLLEELEKPNNQIMPNGFSGNLGEDRPFKACLDLRNVTAKWEGVISGSCTLKDITFNVGPGKLVSVIGPVGSGKSSLLMSILGELPPQSGTVRAHGKIAYVSQHPWVFSGSVRQNIVFGAQFDKARYDKIIRISALSRDLSILPKGDATLIGDRGITLSGGQRARVSLARALYMDADIYLLDDPLSAVDTAVGKHIFDKCIVKYLREKPRILVTHQVQLLPVADNIIILTEGKIVSQGTYTELSQSGVNFSELLKLSEEEDQEWAKQKEKAAGQQGDSLLHRENPKITRSDSVASSYSIAKDYEPEPVQLPEQEERAKGSIELKVYMKYFKAGTGIIMSILVIFFLLLAQVLYIASDWWLARWSNKIEDRHAAQKKYNEFLLKQNITDIINTSNGTITIPTIPEVDSYFNLYVHGGIILALIVSSMSRALLFFRCAVKAGEHLHNMMFARILRTHISFFDTNPVGRVLNRFAKDVGQVDDLLPYTMFDFLQNSLLALGVVVVAGVFNPWVFIPTVPLGVFFILVRRYYVQTSRSVKRLEGTTRSPVFSYLSASLQGIHTIRAMRVEQRFMSEFDACQDLHTEAWFLFLTTSRWLAVRLELISAFFILSVCYCSVLAADSLNSGFVGLSITYTMTLMGLFQWTVRQSTEMENQMISVERVIQYTCLPMEADLESTPDKKPPPPWPTYGSIHAKDVSLQYSSTGPYAVKNLSFDIRAAEKIGIVGRTGAGKSSLITTLFRMVEPQGTLLIDGINIHNIGLHDLRGAISIIPQDPVLFTGSVRKNLDPFQEYSDDVLWKALEEVQLKDAVSANNEGLYMEVNEGGSNFSAGQRQLMCLARAVLGHTRILMIDEATANVDPITDELIQQTIRTKFKQCTVLTIAHRLHTIIDSDRIMVLDAGEIVEMDTPMALLSKGKGGVFYAMVEQLGKAELEHLTDIAAINESKTHKPSEGLLLANGTLILSPIPAESEWAIKNDTKLKDIALVSGEETPHQEDKADEEGTVNIAFITEVTRL
ncbi:multidrug resistance-associated protein 4 [Plakobranchus ocellatus]|uniref:Multidrug resistance-associated protein 4 n=1 Tax=Plakobranchus ocellatus TaxID=259542 RepID=A0AAV3YI79_9GAST|nr:multidrug resistance-associated protein 4 [Plakobranchus ocellatus]